MILPEELKECQVTRPAHLILEPGCFSLRTHVSDLQEYARDFSEITECVAKEVRRNLRHTYLITAMRGGMDARVETGATPQWVGKRGENLMEILALCFAKSAHSGRADRIDEWSRKFGVGKIKAGWWGGKDLGSDFVDPTLKTTLELVLASFGSRQILTLITQLYWSYPGDLIMIEEPEISLHPESQVLLLDLFAAATADEKQIVCSTHSPFLMLALSKVIKSGKLSREDVAIYHVEKGETGTKVRQLELNEHGFVTGWIPSYLKVENELFDEWAESLEKE